MLTRRPRALRMVPVLAAVIPLPRDDTTPPVTNTNLATRESPKGAGFDNASTAPGWRRTDVRGGLGGRRGGGARVEDDHAGLVHRSRGAGQVELGLGRPGALGE